MKRLLLSLKILNFIKLLFVYSLKLLKLIEFKFFRFICYILFGIDELIKIHCLRMIKI
jgi:hypothetical protein